MTSGLMVAVEYRCMRSDEIADGQGTTWELLDFLTTPNVLRDLNRTNDPSKMEPLVFAYPRSSRNLKGLAAFVSGCLFPASSFFISDD
jgi:hypothetical protein